MWERSDWRAMSYHARSLFCYLRTCPVGGQLGIFRFHTDDATDDLGIPSEAVAPALTELEEHGWIVREGRWVWVVDSFATTPGMSLKNQNHRTAVRKALLQVPNGLATAWARAYGLDGYPIPTRDPIVDPIPNGITDAHTNHGDGDGHEDADADTDGNKHTHNGYAVDAALTVKRQPVLARTNDVITTLEAIPKPWKTPSSIPAQIENMLGRALTKPERDEVDSIVMRQLEDDFNRKLPRTNKHVLFELPE
jgi:hypothetical protein